MATAKFEVSPGPLQAMGEGSGLQPSFGASTASLIFPSRCSRRVSTTSPGVSATRTQKDETGRTARPATLSNDVRGPAADDVGPHDPRWIGMATHTGEPSVSSKTGAEMRLRANQRIYVSVSFSSHSRAHRPG
jgi:hypothetical protein